MPAAKDDPRRPKLRRMLVLLEKMYGPSAWSRRGSGLDALVQALLSQNTNWANSTRGYKQLRREFPTWPKVMNADVVDVQRTIAICGLSRMRARRLQAMLRRIKDLRGRLDIEFLAGVPPEDGRAFLTAFHGIGPRSAALVLLFGFDRPVLPVDNGLLRVLRRLRLVRPGTGPAKVEAALAPLIAAGRHYATHTLLFRHAKERCKPKNPACDDCRLAVMCPFGQRRLRHAPAETVRETIARRPARLARFVSEGVQKHQTRDE